MQKWLFLLRGLFPSWRFFDEVGPQLGLQVRYGPTAGNFGEWTNCIQPISRSSKNIFINPQGNYLHACHNHLSHLSSEIAECDSPELLTNRTAYIITRNLVQFQLAELKLIRPPYVYQFRLAAGADHLLISPVHESEA